MKILGARDPFTASDKSYMFASYLTDQPNDIEKRKLYPRRSMS